MAQLWDSMKGTKELYAMSDAEASKILIRYCGRCRDIIQILALDASMIPLLKRMAPTHRAGVLQAIAAAKERLRED